MAEEISTPAPQDTNAEEVSVSNPVTGGVFNLIAQDGMKDRMWMATDYKNGVWTTIGPGGVMHHERPLWMGAGLVARLEQIEDDKESDANQ